MVPSGAAQVLITPFKCNSHKRKIVQILSSSQNGGTETGVTPSCWKTDGFCLSEEETGEARSGAAEQSLTARLGKTAKLCASSSPSAPNVEPNIHRNACASRTPWSRAHEAAAAEHPQKTLG